MQDSARTQPGLSHDSLGARIPARLRGLTPEPGNVCAAGRKTCCSRWSLVSRTASSARSLSELCLRRCVGWVRIEGLLLLTACAKRARAPLLPWSLQSEWKERG